MGASVSVRRIPVAKLLAFDEGGAKQSEAATFSFPESIDVGATYVAILANEKIFIIRDFLERSSSSFGKKSSKYYDRILAPDEMVDARGIAMSPDERFLVVANCGGQNILRIPLLGGSEATCSFSGDDSMRLNEPMDVAFARSKDGSPNASFVLVPEFAMNCVMQIADPCRTMRATRRFYLPEKFTRPTSVAVSPGSEFALVGSGEYGGKQICFLNLRTGDCTRVVSASFCQPEGRCLIAPDASFALVPNATSHTVVKVRVDPSDGTCEVLAKYGSKWFDGPMSGAFSSCVRSNLVAIVPNEQGTDVSIIRFAREQDSSSVRQERRVAIYRIAIALTRFRACRRAVLLRIVAFYPRLGLAKPMSPRRRGESPKRSRGFKWFARERNAHAS